MNLKVWTDHHLLYWRLEDEQFLMNNLSKTQVLAGFTCIAVAVALTLSKKKTINSAGGHTSQGTDEEMSYSRQTECDSASIPICLQAKDVPIILSGLGKAHPAAQLPENIGVISFILFRNSPDEHLLAGTLRITVGFLLYCLSLSISSRYLLDRMCLSRLQCHHSHISRSFSR